MSKAKTGRGDAGDDLRLVTAAMRGEQSAWALLVKANLDAVWNFAFVLLHERQVTDDVVNETFLKAQQSLLRYRGDGQFRSWLLSICRRCCIDENRRHARRSRVVSIEALDHPDADISRSLVRRPIRNDSEETWAMRLALDWAMDHLSEVEREAVLLIKGMRFSSTEAAQITGAAPTTMRSRISRAKAKLAFLLDDCR